MVPESFSTTQASTAGDIKKAQRHQKMSGKIRRSNSYSNTLKPFSVTPGSRSSFGGHASTPTMHDASGDSLFCYENGPDVSAIGPAPVLSK